MAPVSCIDLGGERLPALVLSHTYNVGQFYNQWSPIFNYIDGAADDEATLRQNTASFERCDLVPNVLRGVEAIDKAMRLGANHPMGPLELADFIGLDTCLSVMQVLHEGLADSKYRPCPLLVKYVEAGWLGRKTQRGFYDYRGEKPIPTR